MNSDTPNISPQFHGITMVPKDKWLNYGQALLVIAGSDGEVSDPELEWLTEDLAKEVGVEDKIVDGWKNFDYEKADLSDVFAVLSSSASASFSKLLIYDAIRMSSADGEYALQEKEQVREASRLLKISSETVLLIEALVSMEDASNKLRLSIF